MSSFLVGFPRPLGGMCMRSRAIPDPRIIMMDLSPASFFGQLLDDDFGVLNSNDRQKVPTKCQRHNADHQKSAESKTKSSSSGDQFQVSLDVNQFHPSELSVKTVDNTVVVQGRHEERRDQHGFVSREFTRRYVLPSGVQPENVVTSLTPEGVLVIRAPKLALEPAKPNERSVPITTAFCCADQQPDSLSTEQQPVSLPADQQPASHQTDEQPESLPADEQPASLMADQQQNFDEPSVESTEKME